MVSFSPPPLSQSCIDWNRDVLKRELGLEDEDIIDLPILFKLVEQEEKEYRAVAYYPDMVCSDVLFSCDHPPMVVSYLRKRSDVSKSRSW